MLSRNFKIGLLTIIFLLGLYFYIFQNLKEGLTTMDGNLRCPNILIQKGAKYYLYNSNVAEVPGVNPIQFNSLEEYTEFLEWQRGAGIRCPVLYLQNTYDAQGKRVYKVRPSVSEVQGGLPPSVVNDPVINTQLVDATRADAPYNKNGYPAYDGTDYYVGTRTPLEKMDEESENMLYSANPMDTNWGGAEYTQGLVDSGYYADNEVAIKVA